MIAILGISISASAQTSESFTLKNGKQITAKKSKLKIKFISVIEDSRCPIGVNCVWAGNAKIKITVTSAQGEKTFEINTEMGPKGDQFDGYAINLLSLTPHPKAGVTLNPKKYQGKFSVTRLQR